MDEKEKKREKKMWNNGIISTNKQKHRSLSYLSSFFKLSKLSRLQGDIHIGAFPRRFLLFFVKNIDMAAAHDARAHLTNDEHIHKSTTTADEQELTVVFFSSSTVYSSLGAVGSIGVSGVSMPDIFRKFIVDGASGVSIPESNEVTLARPLSSMPCSSSSSSSSSSDSY